MPILNVKTDSGTDSVPFRDLRFAPRRPSRNGTESVPYRGTNGVGEPGHCQGSAPATDVLSRADRVSSYNSLAA